MDVLKAMSKNTSFAITKSLFSKETFESIEWILPFRISSRYDEKSDCGERQGVSRLFGRGV